MFKKMIFAAVAAAAVAVATSPAQAAIYSVTDFAGAAGSLISTGGQTKQGQTTTNHPAVSYSYQHNILSDCNGGTCYTLGNNITNAVLTVSLSDQAPAGGNTSVQNGSEWPSFQFNLNDFITIKNNVTNEGNSDFLFNFVSDSAYASLGVVGKLMQDGLLDITLSVTKQGENKAPDGFYFQSSKLEISADDGITQQPVPTPEPGMIGLFGLGLLGLGVARRRKAA